MVTSTPERVSATPPLATPAAPPRGRTRKPSAKVLEAQQSLKTRTIAPRSTQNGLPPFPTASVSVSPEREGRSTNLEEIARLITNLKEIITQQSSIITNQNSIIESVRTDLVEIKSEQQSLKSQYAKLQEEIRSLRTQLDNFSASPPLTQSWASVAASGGVAGSGTTLSQTMSAGDPHKEPNGQLVIDISRAGQGVIEKVANMEVAK